MTAAWFVDTSVLLVAVGGDHADRAACRGFMAAAARRKAALHASVEAVQEFLFHRMRVGERATALRATRALIASLRLHDFDADVLRRSLELVELTSLRGRDAVHAATALGAGFGQIVTLDADFAQVPGLEVVHPGSVL